MLLRFLYWLSLAATLLGLPSSPSFVNGDADFASVRTRLTKDHSGKAGDPKEKYFREYLPSTPSPQLYANSCVVDESV